MDDDDVVRIARREAIDRIAVYLPRALWKLRTAAGEPLDGIHALAWWWLREQSGGKPLPCLVTFRAVELAGYFERKSHSSALKWLATIESTGAIQVEDSQTGACGSTCVRMYVLEEVLARQGLDAVHANPQRELFDTHEEPAADVVAFGAAREPEGGVKQSIVPIVDTIVTISEMSQRNAPDVPPALWEALKVQLGDRNAELYLGLSLYRPAEEPRHFYLESQAFCDHLRMRYRAELAQAFADANLPGDVELLFDPGKLARPANCHDSEHYRDNYPRNNQPLEVRSSTRASNQPTNQPTEVFAQQDSEGLPPLLRQAAELYDRIGDPTLWKWVAIAAVVLVEDGKLTQATVDELVTLAGDDFGTAIKERAGYQSEWQRGDWPTQGRLKSRLRRVGIKWKRSWEHGLAPPKPR